MIDGREEPRGSGGGGELPAPPERQRLSILIPRRGALAFAWIASVLLAYGLGWWAAGPGWHAESGPDGIAAESTLGRAEPGPVESGPSRDPARLPADPVRDAAPAHQEPKPAAPAAQPPAQPTPRPAERKKAPAPRKEDPPEPVQQPGPVEAAPAPAVPDVEATSRARRADELATSGQEQAARPEAEALLAAHGSFSGLTAVLVEEGADEVEARLTALRMLQLAGFETEAIAVARELKQSQPGTAGVLESIRRWRLLAPRITRLASSVEDGKRVVVNGTVENPDVGEVRRVWVRVEAFDAAGNVLSTTRARVRPKNLDPDTRGSFTVRFDDVDAASILRTRATVVEWESEVLEPR